MSLGMLRRIEKLEDARRINLPRQFFIVAWLKDDAWIAAETERLRREEGMTDADDLRIIRWLPPQD